MSDLYVVGTGVGGSGQFSLQARSVVQSADIVFYAVDDPVVSHQITKMHPNTVNLSEQYSSDKVRLLTYDAMANLIVSSLEDHDNVCAIFYGHPGVFVLPSHEAILRARANGHTASMLAAVSAEDCLFADLCVDPARSGCQSYECTDFLVRGKIIDATSALVLWQVGELGNLIPDLTVKRTSLDILLTRLYKDYPKNHIVYVYHAAQNALQTPSIFRCSLENLHTVPLRSYSTLYVPPVAESSIDWNMCDKLGVPIDIFTQDDKINFMHTTITPFPDPRFVTDF